MTYAAIISGVMLATVGSAFACDGDKWSPSFCAWEQKQKFPSCEVDGQASLCQFEREIRTCSGPLIRAAETYYISGNHSDKEAFCYAEIPNRLMKKTGCKLGQWCDVIGHITTLAHHYEWI
jgi:hypothetical protein